MTTTQIVDEYFLENRARLLDLAAFLDRLDRSADGEDPEGDFRIEAMRRAIAVLLDSGPGRARRVHMLLSDPTDEPKPALDRKAAYGAFNPASSVVNGEVL
jgi:hypothetical protein